MIKNYLLQIYEARGQDLSHAVKMTGLLYLTLALFLKPSDLSGKEQRSKLPSNRYYLYELSLSLCDIH